jgi:hypothetical protein
MDTTTVQEIIKMIDAKIWNTVYPNKAYKKDDIRIVTLIEFKEHLQSFIEAELNKAENNTVE